MQWGFGVCGAGPSGLFWGWALDKHCGKKAKKPLKETLQREMYLLRMSTHTESSVTAD